MRITQQIAAWTFTLLVGVGAVMALFLGALLGLCCAMARANGTGLK
jgi:hypothetical protein